MRCKEVKKKMYLYIDNQLNPKQKNKIIDHLSTCATCLEEYKKGEEVLNAARSGMPKKLPADLHKNIMREVYGLKNYNEERVKTVKSMFGFAAKRAGLAMVACLFVLMIVDKVNYDDFKIDTNSFRSNIEGISQMAMIERTNDKPMSSAMMEEPRIEEPTKPSFNIDEEIKNEEDNMPRDISISLETLNINESIDKINKIVEEKHAVTYLSKVYAYDSSEKEDEDLFKAEYFIRVKKEVLNDMVSEFSNIAKLLSTVEKQKMTLKNELEKNIVDLEKQVSEKEQIEEKTEEDLRALEGLYSNLELTRFELEEIIKNDEFSIIRIYLTEVDYLSSKEILSLGDFGTRASNGFERGLKNFAIFLQVSMLFLIENIVAILAGIILFYIVFYILKKTIIKNDE